MLRFPCAPPRYFLVYYFHTILPLCPCHPKHYFSSIAPSGVLHFVCFRRPSKLGVLFVFICSDNHTPSLFIFLLFPCLAEHLNELLYRSYMCLAFAMCVRV